MEDYESTVPSELISRITSDSTFLSQIIGTIISLAVTIFGIGALVFQMFEQSVILSLVIVPLFIFNFVFMLIAEKQGYKIGFSIQEAMSKFTGFLSERVYNLRFIKANCKEQFESDRGAYFSSMRRDAQMYEYKYKLLIEIVMHVTDVLLTAGVLIGGAVLHQNGKLQLEDLIAFYMLVAYLPTQLNSLLFQMLSLNQFKGSLAIISELCNIASEENERKEESPAFENLIELKNVSFSYAGTNRKILDNTSFEIPKGKVTAIVGPSGSGKTTLLKLLERFYTPDSGEILYDGKNIEDFHLDS